MDTEQIFPILRTLINLKNLINYSLYTPQAQGSIERYFSDFFRVLNPYLPILLSINKMVKEAHCRLGFQISYEPVPAGT